MVNVEALSVRALPSAVRGVWHGLIKLLFVGGALLAASVAQPLTAAPINVGLPFPFFFVGGPLTIDGNSSVDPGALLQIDSPAGHLTNDGTLTNAGTLSNDANSVLRNIGGTIDSSGLFRNTGTLFNDALSTFNNNTSQVSNEGAGEFINAGALNVFNVLSQRGTGTLTQAGTLTNDGSTYVSDGFLNNTGTLDNNNFLLVGEDAGVFTGNGTLNNSGILNNNLILGNAATLNNNAGGTLTNNAGAGLFNNLGGVLNNAGTLALLAGSTFDNTGGTLNNNLGGVIDLDIDLALGSALAGTINLNNSGTLNNNAVLTNVAGHEQFNFGVLNSATRPARY